MRFMIIVKATADSEAGAMPEEKLIAEMADYHEGLAKAGALLDASGLQPSSKGWRIEYSGDEHGVVDGPFAEIKELIAGYTLIQVGSREEALDWTRRFPNPAGDGREGKIEVRQLFELEDFGPSEAVGRFEAMEIGTNAPSPKASAHVQPYLFFEGRCEEALEFYRSRLGAEVITMMRFEDSPDPDQCTPGAAHKVMHACFRIGDTTVMASDGRCEGRPGFQGFSLALTVPGVEEADRLSTSLAEGGEVQMPMTETFFSPRFGMVADRFGVSWMIVVEPEQAAR